MPSFQRRKNFGVYWASCLFVLACIFSIDYPAYSEDEIEVREIVALDGEQSHDGYVLDLKQLIAKSKKKIEKANVKLKEQAKQRRNQQREAKARQYYEKAMRLYAEERFDEAKAMWEKSIRITEHPEMKGYISESVKKSRKQEAALQKEEMRRLKRKEIERGYSVEEVEDAYAKAVKLYKQKKYLEAKQGFEDVDMMFPDHKAVRSYLMVIQQEIEQNQQELIEKKMKEEALVKRKEKERWRKELERKEEERQERLKIQIEGLYKEALTFYKLREFEAAQDKFREVEWLQPDYKKTVYYLSRIRKDIDREQKRREKELALSEEEREVRRLEVQKRHEKERIEEEASYLYGIAVNLYKDQKYEPAKDKFAEIQLLYPGYKSTQAYISKINKATMSAEEFRREEQKSVLEIQAAQDRIALEEKKTAKKETMARRAEDKKQINKVLYDSALNLYKSKFYIQAKDKFLELEATSPDYKRTRRYIGKIDKKLAKMNKDTVQEEQPKVAEKQGMKKPQAVTEDNAVVQEAVQQRYRAFEKEAEKKYKEARDYYKRKEYINAKMKFIQVEALYPGYKDTLEYLNRIDEDIARGTKPGGDDFGLDSHWRASTKDIVEKTKKAKARGLTMLDEKETQAEGLYDAAKRLYKRKDYIEAQSIFLDVDQLSPGYKSTRSYLKKVKAKIKKEQKLRRAKEREEVVSRREEEKRKRIEILEAERPAKVEKTVEEIVREGTELDDDEAEELRNDSEVLYEKAMVYYREKKYGSAKQTFENLRLLNPDFRTASVKKYIAHSEKNMTEEQKHKLAERENVQSASQTKSLNRKYDQAVALYRNKAYKKAKELFSKIENEQPGYRQAEDYIKKADKKIRDYKRHYAKRGVESRPVVETEVEDKYALALSLYHNGEYLHAAELLQTVEQMVPGYKKTRRFLALAKRKIGRIDSRIEAEMRERTFEEDRLLDRSAKQAAVLRGKDEYMESNKEAAAKEYEDRIQEEQAAFERHRREEQFLMEADQRPPSRIRDKELEDQYRTALALYDNGQYLQAAEIFLKIEQQAPRYKNTRRYLELATTKMQGINPDILEAQSEKNAEEDRRLDQSSRQTALLEGRNEHFDKNIEETGEDYLDMVNEEHTEREARERYREDMAGIIKDDVVQTLEGVESALEEREQKKLEEMTEEQRAANRVEEERLARERQAKMDADAQVQEKFVKEQMAKIVAEKEARLQKERESKIQKRQREEESKAREAEVKAKLTVMYKEARKFYKDDDIEAAKTKFKAIEEIRPGYKSAQKYLVKIERKIAEQKEAKERETRKKIQEDQVAKAKEREKVRLQEEAEEKARKKQIDEQRGVEEEEVENKAIALYKNALELYQENDFEAAQKKFEAIEAIRPGYKSTRDYLAKIERIMEKQEEKLDRAVEKKLSDISGNKQKKDHYAPSSLTQYEKRRWDADIAAIYEEACALYRDKNYLAAKVKFGAVEGLRPGYKSARSYVRKIEGILGRRERKQDRREERARREKEWERLKKEKAKQEEMAQKTKQEDEKGMDKQAGKPAEKEMKEERQVSAGAVKAEEKMDRREEEQQAKADEKEKAMKRKEEQRLAKIKEKEELKRKEDARRAQEQIKANIASEKKRKQEERRLAREKERNLKRETRAIYTDAVAAYKRKNYSVAKDRFLEVEKMIPGYKGAEKYISKIDVLLAKEDALFKEKIAEKLKKDSEPAKAVAAKTEETAGGRETASDKTQEDAGKAKMIAEKERQKDKKVVRRDLDELYSEAISFSKANRLKAAEDRFKDYEIQLNRSGLSRDYINKRKARLDKDRDRLYRRIAKFEKQERKKSRQERYSEVEERFGREKDKELMALERKIKVKEDRLRKDKEEEANRLKKERAKLITEALEADDTKDTAADKLKGSKKKELALSEKEKREEMERLIRERRKEVQEERERIRAEFENRIEQLYDKAMDLKKSGDYQDANVLLGEINAMKPNYKKTAEHLAETNKILSSQPRPSQSSVPKSQTPLTREEIIRNSLNELEQGYSL